MIPQDRTDDGHRAGAACSTTCCRCCAPSSRPSSTRPSAPSPPRWRAGASGSARTSSSSTATSPGSTRSCRRIKEDISGLADVDPDLRRRGPRPGADAAQLLGDDQTRSGPRPTPTPASSPAPPASRRRPASSWRTTRAGSSSWRRSAGRCSASSPGTRPSTRACSRAWRSPTTSSATRFANGELHITLEVTQARHGYQPGEEPAWGENRGPELLRAAEPAAALAGQPVPGRHQERRQRRQRCPASWSTRRAGCPARRGAAGRRRAAGPADGRPGRRGARPRDAAVRPDGPRDGGGAVVKTGPVADQADRLHRGHGARDRHCSPPPSATSGSAARTTYRALFTDVTGLLKGDDVRIAGVRVGEVDSVAVTERAGRSLAEVTFTVDSDRAARGEHQGADPLPQPGRPALRRADRGRRLGPTAAAERHDPAAPDPAGAGPHRAVQRLQAAVRRAEPQGRQLVRVRDHQDAAGRGRQRQQPARAHRVADHDAGRPRRGDRPDDRQPQHRARHGRRARRSSCPP